jgi:hypothetical protein
MFVGGRAVLVSMLAMLVRRFGVLLRLLVLAKVMMMGGLVMMMGGGVVMSGGLMMMLARRMLRGLCHDVFLPTGPEKSAGCSFDMGGFLFAATLFQRRRQIQNVHDDHAGPQTGGGCRPVFRRGRPVTGASPNMRSLAQPLIASPSTLMEKSIVSGMGPVMAVRQMSA